MQRRIRHLKKDLKRYDTIKTCPWNFLKFSWVVHYTKTCKKSGLSCYIHSFRDQIDQKYYKN